jgi:DNA-binding response OmpR family regulator
MRLLFVEDEEKVSRLIVKSLTAERFAVDVVEGKGSRFLVELPIAGKTSK